eukprot:3993736-Lingulodinium_polyedra.AAC.1
MHAAKLACMECASVRFVSRCDGETSIRPRHCTAFSKRCAMARSSRRFAAAAARKSHVCALRARA